MNATLDPFRHPRYLSDMDRVFTVTEVAKRLKSTKRAIYAAVRAKRLAAVRVGKELRIAESAVAEFLRGGR